VVCVVTLIIKKVQLESPWDREEKRVRGTHESASIKKKNQQSMRFQEIVPLENGEDYHKATSSSSLGQ